MKQEGTTFERMSMTPIDIVCETEAPNATYVRGLLARWRTLRDFSIRMRTSIWLGQVFSKESTSWIENQNHLLGSLVDMIVINAMQVLLDRRLLSVLGSAEFWRWRFAAICAEKSAKKFRKTVDQGGHSPNNLLLKVFSSDSRTMALPEKRKRTHESAPKQSGEQQPKSILKKQKKSASTTREKVQKTLTVKEDPVTASEDEDGGGSSANKVGN